MAEAGPLGQHERPVRLVFVCTANQVRSPFAAALTRRALAAQPHPPPVVVDSAGLLGGGEPAVDRMVRVARRFDVDLSDHLSRPASRDVLRPADLVVAMTGQHVIDLATSAPECRDRIVTLAEWANDRRESDAPWEWSSGYVRAWARSISSRPVSVLLSGQLDVADPIGRSQRQFRRTAQQIHDLLVDCLGVAP